MTREEEEELAYLRWFYGSCDFGPAHGDVIEEMVRAFEEETGKKPPEKYDVNHPNFE